MISRDYYVGEFVFFIFFLLGVVCINEVCVRLSERGFDRIEGGFPLFCIIFLLGFIIINTYIAHYQVLDLLIKKNYDIEGKFF